MMGSVRTDFNEGDSYQKVVRFNHNGSHLVTGGCDGVLRVWKVSIIVGGVHLKLHMHGSVVSCLVS